MRRSVRCVVESTAVALVFLAETPPGRAPSADSPFLIVSESAVYHRPRCESLSLFPDVLKVALAAPRVGLKPCAICKPLGPAQAPGEEASLGYLISAATEVRLDPSLLAAPVTTFPVFAVAAVEHAVNGWIYVRPTDTRAGAAGWLPLNIEDLMPEEPAVVKARAEAVRPKPWPDGVKVDLIRRRVREGLSAEQVLIAWGQPAKRNPSGEGERWDYKGTSIWFAGDRVVRIGEPSCTS
jgi:hypothetical protein